MSASKPMRSMARRPDLGSQTITLQSPFLAEYMFSSARRNKVSASWAWSGSTATPRLASTATGKPSTMHGYAKSGPHPLGHLRCRGHRIEVSKHEGKLVAADAGQQVRRPAHIVHPRRHAAEHAVAHLVAQPVVDVLEAVKVDEHDADPRPATSGR